MFCGKCGEKLPDGAKFCGKCGWKVEGAEIVQEQQTPEETPVELTADEPAEELTAVAKEEAPKKEAKPQKMLLLLLLPVVLFVVIGIVIGAVIFVKSLKRETVDLADVVTFQMSGYSGYGTATVVIDEDALEDKYEDVISKHTKLRWSKFVREVDLLEYEVTELSGLSNGDKITLTWECNTGKALDEYKVETICEDVVYTVTGLTELAKVDPFEDFEVTFSGISGEGMANVNLDGYPDYLNYFWYNVSETYSLSNGDSVVISFDTSGNKDYVAERYGYELYPTEKTYTVSGLTEYVSKEEELTDAAMKPLLASAEKHIYNHVKSYWAEESSLEDVACVGHFISKRNDTYSGTKNVIGLTYKVNASVVKDGRKLEVEYYYPVLFPNVVLLENGSFSYEEDGINRTYETFYKSFTAENPEDVDVPSGSWYFYGFETMDALEEAYESYSIGWTNMETELFIEKNHTETVNAQLKKDFEAELKKVEAAAPEALITDAMNSFLETTNGWQDTASVNGIKCVETKVYGSNVVSETIPGICYEVVLEVNAKVEYEDMSEDFPYYYVVRYQGVTVGADGKLTAVYTSRTTVNGEFTKMLGDKEIYKGWFSPAVNVWVYNGYQTLEETKDAEAEIYQEHVYYTLKTAVPYVTEAEPDMSAWSNAFNEAVIETAIGCFYETTAEWPESAVVNSVECVEQYLISSDVTTLAKDLVVLLKVNANVSFADHTEAFDYYYVVRLANAVLSASGYISADTTPKAVTEVSFTKMLGDEEVPGPDGFMLNVWNIVGHETKEAAEAIITAERIGHVNCFCERIPSPLEEVPEDEPVVEGDEAA